MKEALAANQGDLGNALFARFAANSTWFTPTLVGDRGFANGGDVSAEVRTSRYRVLDALIGITGAMHRAGVRLLAGSDFSDAETCVRPGADLHDELEYFVRAGLTPMEALWTATAGPAEFLGFSATRGGLRPGMAADQVLLGSDPRRNIGSTRDIRVVIAAGRLVPADDGDRASVPVPPCMR